MTKDNLNMVKKVLVVNCCIRKEKSATQRLLNAYLKKYCSGCEIEELKLYDLDLKPLLLEELEKRDYFLEKKDYENDFFKLARQFRDADRVVFAAPFWDMSFPSLLKVYIERVCASGITFSSSAEGGLQGMCRADKFVYISSAGGFLRGENEGERYIRTVGRKLLGVNETEGFTADGLDVDPSKREERLQSEIKRLFS